MDTRHLRVAAEQLLLAISPSKHTLLELVEHYDLGHLSSPQLAPRTVELRKRCGARLVERFGDRQLSGSWRREAIEVYRAYPRPTASLIVNTLATMLRWADRAGMRQGDAQISDLAIIHSTPRERWLTVDELGKLLDALDEMRKNKRRGHGPDALLACALVPLRVGAICSLSWPNVAADGSTVVAIDKGKLRRLRVCDEARDLLQRMRRVAGRSPWVFPGRRPGTHVSPVTALLNIRTACEIAGVDRRGVVVHTLRHSYATNLLLQGEASDTVQEALGHSSKHMTRRYLHVQAPGLIEAGNRYEASIAAARKGGRT